MAWLVKVSLRGNSRACQNIVVSLIQPTCRDLAMTRPIPLVFWAGCFLKTSGKGQAKISVNNFQF